MKLFSRKNNEDILDEIVSELKMQNEDLTSKIEEIISSNKELEKEIFSLKKEQENYVELKIEFLNLKNEICELKGQLEENYGEMVDLTKNTTDTNKLLVNRIDKLIVQNKPTPTPKSQQHMAPKFYLNKEGVLCNAKGVSTNITIEDMVMLKNNCRKMTISQLSKELDISLEHCRVIVQSIKNGDYDKLYSDYEKFISKKNKPQTTNRDIFVLLDGGLIKNKRGIAPYTVSDLICIKKSINSDNPLYTPAYLSNKLGLKIELITRLKTDIKKGLFDELFAEAKNVSKKTVSKEESGKFHFVDVAKSYHEPYEYLRLDGFDVRSKKRSILTIQTLLEIKEHIPKMNASNIVDYANRFNIHRQKFARIVWNIEEGYFDGVINEYSSRNYTFENKNNFLYIDGEYTGITLEKGKVMVATMANTLDKQECVNGFIHTYDNLNSKYIRIICNEYANNNLNKILNKEAVAIPKCDNPQKRRERLGGN